MTQGEHHTALVLYMGKEPGDTAGLLDYKMGTGVLAQGLGIRGSGSGGLRLGPTNQGSFSLEGKRRLQPF